MMIDFGDRFLEEPLSFSTKPMGQSQKTTNAGKICLQIARFSQVPKLDFSKVHVNKSKVLELFIHNPNDYPVVIYIDKPSESEFSLELNETDLQDEGNRDPASSDIVMGLEPNENRSIFVRWSPTTARNTRETLSIKWEGGSKLQVVFLGSAVGNQRKRKATQTSKPKVVNINVNKITSPTNRKVLGTIQPETPSRRTTFSISNLQSNVENLQATENNSENINKANTMSSCSPLSFEKTKPPQLRVSKSNLTVPKSRNNLNITQKKFEIDSRRQTYHVPKKAPANKNLFGNEKPKTIVNKSNSTENTNKENEKPKSFLRRKSVSQTISKPSVQKGLALKKLKLSKGPKTSMPRHPMPFAAKNMFYDERWIDKQERGFANWLNYVLTPPEDEGVHTINEQKETDRRGTFTVDARRKQPVAPTKEDLSFRAYSLRRRMVQLRRSACLLYQSEEFMFVIHKIEKEIECGMIAVRMERHILADLGIKNQILKMLLSYNSLWLRIGMEVIYGEIIPLHSNNDITNLSKFITHRLLENPDIAAEHSHPSVPNLFKPGYEEALSKFALKKFLLVVLFLDHAKRKRLISHDPCLFNKNSEIKASRDVLLLFAREFLKGEGDITRHLSYMGISVGHSQTVLDEYDFGIKNIAVDLRDGVRLIRVVELLTEDWSLSGKVRLPAISRLQKIHNVGVALESLKAHGLSLVHDAKSVVDGHREKTLMILWQTIFHFQVGMLLDVEKLKEEVNYLRMSRKLQYDLMTEFENSTRFLGISRHGGDSEQTLTDQLYFKSEKLSLLLQWCQAVCSHYDVKIENFTVSFSDGIAFCCLINFYHADILPKPLINHETTQTCSISQQEEGVEDDFFYDNWTKCFSPNTGINRRLETLLHNEKENYRVLNEAIHELGGIPSLLRASDMSNTIPDEKVVITYVSFLCSRLLGIQKETRAARKIQLAWRQYKLSIRKRSFEVKNAAATKIQNCFRGYITRMNYLFDRECVIICQSIARRWLVHRHTDLQHAAAYIIQSVFLGHLETSQLRYRFLQMRASAIVIQRAFREHLFRQVQIYVASAAVKIQASYKMRNARNRFQQIKQAAITIQTYYRSKKERSKYLKIRRATVVLQSQYRRHLVQKNLAIQNNAAFVIQQRWRSSKMRDVDFLTYTRLQKCCVYLQSLFRMKQARESFLRQKCGVILIQRVYRLSVTRKQESIVRKTKRSIVKIQSVFRCYSTRKQFIKQRSAASAIQKHWRAYCLGKQNRDIYLKLRYSAIIIQSFYRMKTEHSIYVSKQKSVIKIQSLVRMVACRKSYLSSRQAIIKMQARTRGIQARKSYVQQGKSVLKLQSIFRMFIAKRKFMEQRNAAVKIQSWMRMAQKRRKFSEHREACLKIQSFFRASLQRHEIVKKRRAAMTMQSVYKGYVTRRRYRIKRQSCIRIQSLYKSHIVQTNYRIQKTAAVKIQSMYRTYTKRTSYLNALHAVVMIQSFVRMVSCQQRFQKTRKSAILLQSLYRKNVERKHYIETIQSLVALQSWFKMFSAQKLYMKQKSSAMKVQAVYRGYSTRKLLHHQKNAALVIQTNYRRFSSQSEYIIKKKAVIKMQASVRMYQTKSIFVKKRKAVLILQSSFRSYLLKKQHSVRNAATVRIQSVYRMHRELVGYRKKRRAVVKIQAAIRRLLEIQEHARRRKAIIKVQSFCRMLSRRNQYTKIRKAILILQSTTRMYILRNEFLKKQQAAVAIQTIFRGFICRRKYNANVRLIVKIQAFVRMFTARSKFLVSKGSAIKIQSFYRMCKIQKDLKEKEKAATKIQALYKCYKIRQRFVSQRNAFLCIQSYFRMRQLQKKYHQQRNAIIMLQSFYRMARQRNRYKRQREAVLKIQTFYRMKKNKQSFERSKLAAIKIQSSIRMFIARNEYLKYKQAAISIQIAWKSYYKKRNAHAKIVHCAVLLQSYVRMQRCRKQYLNTIKAIVKMQSYVRCHQTRKLFLSTQDAILCLQSFTRMILIRSKYQKQQEAAIKLQSVYRMHQVRLQYLSLLATKTLAATCIQSTYRMHTCRKQYVAHRNTCIFIQRSYRANVKGYQEFLRYNIIRGGVITIQALARGYLTRKKLTKMGQAATKIQALYKCYKIRQYFVSQRNAFLCIQSYFRMRHVQKSYHQQRNAIIMLQSFYRMAQQRNRYKRQREAVLKIQTFYRMKKNKQSFERSKLAAIKIQSSIRMFIARNEYLKYKQAAISIQLAWKSYYKKRNAHAKIVHCAVLLQSYVRMQRCRKQYLNTIKAIVKMQSYVRCHQTRKLFLSTQDAILCLQSFTRMILIRSKYQKQQEAAIKLQSVYRMHQVRLQYLRLLTTKTLAATCIQSTYRMHTCRKQYVAHRNTCIFIQRSYRANVKGYQEFLRYNIIRGGVITIQALARGYLTRKKLTKMGQAATKIQALYKCYKIRQYFVSQRNAFLCIQSYFRMRHVQKSYHQQRNAIIMLQSFYRMAQQRNRYKRQREAVLKIQTFYRMKENKQSFDKSKLAAIKIQSTIRMFIARNEYLKYKQAAISIQLAWKSYYKKRNAHAKIVHCAVLLQSYVRMQRCRQQYLNTIKAIVKMQSYVRCHQTRKLFLSTQDAILCLQSFTRMILIRSKYQKQQEAAIKLQSVYRMHQVRLQYLRLLTTKTLAATCIQSTYRMYTCRKQYVAHRNTCIFIQRSYRANVKGYREFLRYNIIRGGVITIQALARGYLARKKLTKMEESAVILQSYVRMYLTRRYYTALKSSTVTIQKCARMILAQREYEKIRENVIRIQRVYRVSMARKKEFKRQHSSALLVQKVFKIAVAKRYLQTLAEDKKTKNMAAVTIQTTWRKCKEAQRMRTHNAVCTIQSFMRVIPSRNSFLKMKHAAVVVQRRFRLNKSRKNLINQLRLQKKSIQIIESCYCGYVAMKNQRHEYLQARSAIVVLQRFVRMYLCNLQNRKREEAAIKIQNTYRSHRQQQIQKALFAERQRIVFEFADAIRKCLSVLKLQRWSRRLVNDRKEKGERLIQQAATKIQCSWKGYSVRRRIKDKRLKKTIQRIDAANNNVTEPMKLCNRTRSALDYLLKVKNLSTVYEALQQLDTSTSLSFKCCERLVEDNALPVIYRIINYGNRSLPWISIKQVAFSILLNLAKCQSTYKAVYKEQHSLEYIFEQMTNFRDKKTSIFPMACTLLTILCHDVVIKKDFQKNKKCVEKIEVFLRLSERKHKIETQRNKKRNDFLAKEQQYSKTTWHRRASSIHCNDPHLSIQILATKVGAKL